MGFTNKIFIYGFDEEHVVKAWQWIGGENAMNVRMMKIVCERFLDTKPDIVRIYAVDNYLGLKRDYDESVHARLDDFVRHYEFEDLVARRGICIYG